MAKRSFVTMEVDGDKRGRFEAPPYFPPSPVSPPTTTELSFPLSCRFLPHPSSRKRVKILDAVYREPKKLCMLEDFTSKGRRLNFNDNIDNEDEDVNHQEETYLFPDDSSRLFFQGNHLLKRLEDRTPSTEQLTVLPRPLLYQNHVNESYMKPKPYIQSHCVIEQLPDSDEEVNYNPAVLDDDDDVLMKDIHHLKL